MNSEVQVNPITETMVVELIDTMFKDVLYLGVDADDNTKEKSALDPETIYTNLQLACEGGMSRADRAISRDLAMYLIKHFGIIYMGLISNVTFREMFVDAVDEEIALDDSDEDTVRVIRGDMREGETPFSKSKFVLYFSTTNNDVYDKLSHMISDSLDALMPFAKEIEELTDELSTEAKIQIGFCINNFMYLIRAFAKNPTFANCVKEVIENVKRSFGDKIAEPVHK